MPFGRPLIDVLNNNASPLVVCYVGRYANRWVRIREPRDKARADALCNGALAGLIVRNERQPSITEFAE